MSDENLEFCFWCYIHDVFNFNGEHKCRYDALSGAHLLCNKCEDFVKGIQNRQAAHASHASVGGRKKNKELEKKILDIEKVARSSSAPQANAAKELAHVRSHLQQYIEDGGRMENRTLGNIAAAFCRDVESKETLEKYEQNRQFKSERKSGVTMSALSRGAAPSRTFVVCLNCGSGKAFREGWRCLACAKTARLCDSCGDLKSFPGEICDECYAQLQRYENLGI